MGEKFSFSLRSHVIIYKNLRYCFIFKNMFIMFIV